MLNLIWFFGLTLIGYYFWYREIDKLDSNPTRPYLIFAGCFLGIAPVIFSEKFFAIFDWLIETLPESGKGLNVATAWLLFAILWSFWIIHPYAILMVLKHKKGNVSLKSLRFSNRHLMKDIN